MRFWKHGIPLAAVALLAWPLADGAAFAQRGERGGNRGGDGGGRSFSGGGQSTSGGGRSFSGGERSTSGGSRSFSGGERSYSRGQQGGNDGREYSSRSSQREGRSGQAFSPRSFDRSNEQGQRQQSYFRGPDGQQFERRSSDNRQFSRDDGDNRRFDENYRDRFDDRSRFDDDDRSDRRRRDDDYNRSRDDRREDWNRFGRDDWRASDIRRNWWQGWDRDYVPFRYGWWDDYYGSSWPVYAPYRYSRWSNRPNYWWGWTPAGRLTSWLAFGWDRPRYWGYGPGANVYYRDNYVYYDDDRAYSVDKYYQQIYDLAHSVPDISQEDAEQMDWRPLGVFALTRDNDSESQRALQIAVNQDGVLTGTYFNRENGHVHPVSGMVDEGSQRAAWAFADGEHEDVVFETAFYNLTRPESTMMVHFGPQADETEVWQLVRLEQPESAGGSTTGGTGRTNSLP